MSCSPKYRGRVILVHGFNVRDEGEKTVGALTPYFEAADFEVKRFRYGWLGLLGVRTMNDRFATLLADMVDEGDIIVGHSNGGCLAYLAAQKRAKISQLVLINPALDAGKWFPPQLERIHVWHNPDDAPVSWAKFLPWHHWGDMGAVGYRGRYDRRVHCYNTENGFEIGGDGHSDIFTGNRLEFFGPRIVQAVVDNLKPTQP